MANIAPLMTSARTGESSRDSWRTPKWLYDLLDKEFHFNLDAAADDNNALCDFYLTQEEDGLKNDWWGSTWVNPPFSQLKAWAKKGYEEAHKGNATVVMLVAARTDTAAFWNYLRYGEVRFLPGRLKFTHPNGAKYSAPFPSCITIFHRHLYVPAKTIFWEVREPK